MEPTLLIGLLAVGFGVLVVIQVASSKKHESVEQKVMRGYFLLGLSGLMAKIAMADGTVTDDETEMAHKFFAKMDITDAERAMCIGNFVTSRREKLEVRDHARRFMAYANRTSCRFLYDLLWRISGADGRLDEGEDKMLREIATCLGLDEADYKKFKSGEKASYNPSELRAAGVPESLVALA